MKKLLVIVASLIFATTVGAVDLQLSGDFTFRGSMIQDENGDLVSKVGNDGDYTYYNQDMNLWAKFVVNENTMVTTKFAILDYNWVGGSSENGFVNSPGGEFDVERAWLTHKFSENTTLNVGLMDGGTWATSFADTLQERQRIVLLQMTPVGAVVGVIEKFSEDFEDGWNEDNEWNNFAIGYVTKIGEVYVKPLFYCFDVYKKVYKEIDLGGAVEAVELVLDKPTYVYALGLDGSFEKFGFESEIVYQNNTAEQREYSVYGIYGNGWSNIDSFKLGAIFAYGSTEEYELGGLIPVESGFAFGDDFDLTIFLSDWANFGGGRLDSGLDSGLTGMTVFQLYGEMVVSEQLTAGASFTYMTSNWETGDSLRKPDDPNSILAAKFKDATAYEVDATLDYKITDALTYSAGIGIANIDMDIDDIDQCMRAYHKLVFNF